MTAMARSVTHQAMRATASLWTAWRWGMPGARWSLSVSVRAEWPLMRASSAACVPSAEQGEVAGPAAPVRSRLLPDAADGLHPRGEQPVQLGPGRSRRRALRWPSKAMQKAMPKAFRAAFVLPCVTVQLSAAHLT